MIVDERLVAAHIELEYPHRLRRRFGHLLEARIAHGTQHMGDPETVRGPHHGSRGAIVKAFQRAHRRQHNGQPQPAPKRGDGRVDMGDVAQHPRPKAQGIERKTIAAQRGFGLGRADDVIPIVLVEVLPRLGDDLVQDLEIGLSPHQALVGDFFGVVVLHIR